MRLFSALIILLLVACGTENETKLPVNESYTDSLAPEPVNNDTYLDEENNFWINNTWSNSYHDVPAIYANKIDSMVKQAAAKFRSSEMDYTVNYINAGDLKKLKAIELVYYCLAYPGVYSQVCAEDGDYDSTGLRIRTYFRTDNTGEEMTSLQRDALLQRSDSVILILEGFVAANPGKPCPEVLSMLYKYCGPKSIPVVVKAANENTVDHYTFLLKMIEEYQPFMETELYEKLYGENATTQNVKILATKENTDLITNLAMRYYKEKAK